MRYLSFVNYLNLPILVVVTRARDGVFSHLHLLGSILDQVLILSVLLFSHLRSDPKCPVFRQRRRN